MIRLAIIEDQPELRKGLEALIGLSAGFKVCGGYSSMEEALPAIDRERPDVALLDLGLPGMSGIEGIPLLKKRIPTIQIIVLTIYEDDDRIFEAICAGASGYLLKKTAPGRLLESIAEVMSGGSPMSPEVARRVLDLFRRTTLSTGPDPGLTPHERRLLKLLVEGHTYGTAAQQFGISINTVAFHMREIYKKLQVHSKSQAVAAALKRRLV